MSEGHVYWEGASGQSYKYWVFPIGTSLRQSPGNYIYAKEIAPGCWAPCYIGQTDDLSQGPADEEKEASAKQNGATHIHVHLNSGIDKARRSEQRDLVGKWRPPCNDQHSRKQNMQRGGSDPAECPPIQKI